MYLSEKEQFYKRCIDERIGDERLLEIEYVIDNGNRCNIRNTNGQLILMGLTIEQAYWVVHGICNFYNKLYPER